MKQLLISESKAKLTVRSSKPTDKKMRVSMFGNCQDLPSSQLSKL
jgi:hypothetical protein